MFNIRELLSWRFGFVWCSWYLNLASVTSGVLFSYTSTIYGEFYFGESKGASWNLRNKVLAKIKHSTVLLHIQTQILCHNEQFCIMEDRQVAGLVVCLMCIVYFQLNRSDSDSCVRRGPFHRNTRDRRSFRYKKVVCHLQETCCFVEHQDRSAQQYACVIVATWWTLFRIYRIYTSLFWKFT